jgi:ubiquinone/menaquinone biosynthesis C-methylase UbiE
MSIPPSRRASTVDAYNEVADAWDRGLGFRSPQFAARMRCVIVGLLQPAAGGRLALELGAGTGWMLDATSPLFGELRAIEPSLRMLEICRRRIATAGLRTVRADAGDAISLDGIADASVDAIYAIGLLDAVPEPACVLAACERVLKPGGLLVLSTANGACPWYALRDRLLGTRDVRTGRYLAAADLVRFARLAGLTEIDVLTWGASPQRLAFAPAVAVLDMLERVATTMGLSRYLGVLTASFRKLEQS